MRSDLYEYLVVQTANERAAERQGRRRQCRQSKSKLARTQASCPRIRARNCTRNFDYTPPRAIDDAPLGAGTCQHLCAHHSSASSTA